MPELRAEAVRPILKWAGGKRQLLPELKRRRKTVLVITHDDRYFHLADRLLKLDYGQLIAAAPAEAAAAVAQPVPSAPPLPAPEVPATPALAALRPA